VPGNLRKKVIVLRVIYADKPTFLKDAWHIYRGFKKINLSREDGRE
jgi:hypothetical protein